MDDKELESILKNSSPEKEQNTEHKNSLRRELLNSNKFGEPVLSKILTSKKLVYTLPTTVMIVLLYLLVYQTGVSPAKEQIINSMNAAYAGFTSPENIFASQSKLVLSTVNDGQLNFKVTSKYDPASKSLLVETSNLKTGELIHRSLKINGKIYVLADPILQFYNTAGRRSKHIIAFSASTDSISIDSIRGRLSNINRMSVLDNREAYIKIKPPQNDSSEMVEKLKSDLLVKIFPETNFNEYIFNTPLHILDELNTYRDSVKLINDDDKHFWFELRSEMSMVELRSLAIDLSADSTINANVVIKNLDSSKSLPDDSTNLTWIFDMIDSGNTFPKKLRAALPDKVKLVKINKASHQIDEINYSVRKDTKKLKLASMQFNSTSSLQTNPDYFDPVKLGLVENNHAINKLHDRIRP